MQSSPTPHRTIHRVRSPVHRMARHWWPERGVYSGHETLTAPPRPARPLAAQGTLIRGVVTTRDVPLANVNVFDLNTLSGAVTRDDGRFSFRVDSARTSVHLVTRAIGFGRLDTTIVLPHPDTI